MINIRKVTSVSKAEPSIGEITYAIEFLTTALRALADGHSSESPMVEDPLLWGYSKINDMVTPILARGRREASQT